MNKLQSAKTGLTRRDVFKLGGAAAAIAVAPSLLAAGGDTATSAASAGTRAKVTLTFWDTNAGPDRTPEYTHLISQFESSHPSIKINYVGIPEADYIQKLQTAIAGGQVPDVANPGVGSISPFIAQNGLLSLDKDFSKWSGKSDFSAKVISDVRGVAPDKKLYALPYSANLNVLYYRSDLVQQAGLPNPGSSWSNFYKVASALTKPSQGMYGFGLRGGSGSVATLESWLYAATGISTFFDKHGHATLDQPAMVSAMKRWVDMYDKVTSKSDLNNEYRAMVAEFDSGHAAMIFHNLGSYPNHVQALGADKVGVTVLPPAPNGKVTLEGTSYLGDVILRGAKHPAQAWTFVSWLSSPTAQGYFNQQIGQIPADEKAANEAWVKQNAAAQAAKAALANKNTVTVTPPLYLPEYSTTQKQMEPALQKVLLGQLSPSNFLQQWSGQLNTALSQFKKAHRNH